MLDYDLRLGRTYLYFEGSPLYPFGYGLSYTTFEYGAVRAEVATVRAGGSVNVSVELTNTGKRAGDEVVQLYAKMPDSRVKRPNRQLVAFRRVRLAPGESKTVVLAVDTAELSYWDVRRRGFVVEPGRVELDIGRSASDVVATAGVEVVA
jgi:beta-glucosidase